MAFVVAISLRFFWYSCGFSLLLRL